MLPDQINFENLHSSPFYNEIFSDAEDKKDPDENFFDEVNTQNFECAYLFPLRLRVFFLRSKILKLLMQSMKTQRVCRKI